MKAKKDMASLRRLINQQLKSFGYEITKEKKRNFVNPDRLEKADKYLERYREIISDPLNMLIQKVPEAGYVDKMGCVILHNGNRVPIEGPLAYYKDFSDILVINRGVHEPLEEFCFQQAIEKLNITNPNMLELGCYWAHYSMWFMKAFPNATCFMVEPDPDNIKCGKNNFEINHLKGEFIRSFVGNSGFKVDAFLSEKGLSGIDLLHSDIQGFEVEMLEGASDLLNRKAAKYAFVSTHSQDLHRSVVEVLSSFGYRIEVSADVDFETTSSDGFVLASSPLVEPVFQNFKPLGRTAIARSSSSEIGHFIANTMSRISQK
ncbi:FkbM family methyltransferase [Agrobacterium rosae]|uniref:FkbM family methyltransferase n=1 Tax=Agrobacterium rosae TaxID=1972867 RepID=UPI0020337B24|nr:FkbM family methyltransferase [Agrobacterium rosae]